MKKIIKMRTINVDGMTCNYCTDTVKKALLVLDGVKTVEVHNNKNIYIEYDLMKINLERIEEKILDLNFSPGKKFFDILMREWVYFTEQNEYDNIYAEPHPCCSSLNELNKR